LNGDWYFASERSGGIGQGDICFSALTNKGLEKPINLGGTINSSKAEWNLDINDEGKILIFEASQAWENKQ
jgi:hypothetical protein